MKPFLEKFFPQVLKQATNATRTAYCVYDSHTLTVFSSSLYIAGFVSSMMASRFTTGFGRKFTMLLGGLTFLIGGILTGAAQNVAMLIFGRLFLGFGVGFNNQVVMAVLLEVRIGGDGTKAISKNTGVEMLILMCIFAAGFGWLSWIIPSEIFPLKIRPIGQSISVAVNFATTFVLSQTFLAMLCRFNYWTFLLFACWIIVMTLFVALFLPETKALHIDFTMDAV